MGESLETKLQHEQRERALRQVITRARCILWEATVTEQPNGDYDWGIRFLTSEEMRHEFGLAPQPQADDAQRWNKAILPEQFPRLDKAARDAFRNHSKGYQQEFTIQNIHGHRRRMREDTVIHEIVPGLFYVVGIMVDITEMKNVEQELARERDLLKTLMDNIPDQIYFKDKDSHFQKINNAVARTLGAKSPEEAIGKADADYFRKEDAAAFRADDAQVMASGTPLRDRIEKGVIKGVETWMSTTKAPIFDAHGKAIGIVGISRDITQRIHTEIALRESEERLRLLMRQLPAILWTTDLDLCFTSCTGAGLELIYLSPDQLRGVEVGTYFNTAAANAAVVQSHKNALNGSPTTFELEWLGQTFHTHVEPMRGPDGRICGCIGVAFDISERKIMEKRLAEANSELTRLAREDALTGLMNRRMVLEIANAEWVRAQRFGKTFSVVIIDADDFKLVNDHYGHRSGDTVLKSIAARLKETIRNVDSLGRYGGEEFLIILPETGLEGAQAAAEKILCNVRNHAVDADGQKLKITVSIGVAAAAKTDKDIDALIHRADTALYSAKHKGKNCVVAAT